MKKLVSIVLIALSLSSAAQTSSELSNILAAQSPTATGPISTQNLVPAGAATANSAVEVTVGNSSTASIQVTGTYTGALSIQTTTDGTTWVTNTDALTLKNKATGVTSATITSAATGVYIFACEGLTKFRVTGLAAVTGTATVTIKCVTGGSMVFLAGSIPAGAAAIGSVAQGAAGAAAWLSEIRTGTTNGSTTAVLNSAASTNATLVKSSAGILYFAVATNTTASAKYVRFYNLTTAPTVGTSTPTIVYTIPANSSVPIPLPSVGLKFATGISFAITAAAAYLDATAVAAGDVVLTYNFN